LLRSRITVLLPRLAVLPRSGQREGAAALNAAPDVRERELDEWMARLADGDRRVFDPLFRALWPRALRLARTRLPEAQANDAAQATMVKVFARASEFRAGAPALPWFYAVAANEVRSAARACGKAKAREEAADAADAVAGEGDPEAAAIDRELYESLERAIAALDDASAEAIGAMLGRSPRPAIAPAALRKRISRAYARLRLLLLGGLDAE
jgi:RNA polymerase sigma-70 factor (ECF subfamily)